MTDQEPGYWDQIESFEEDWVGPPDAATLAADEVNRMMGALRRLNTRVAEYDMLHLAEQVRLEARRAAVLGPIIRRVEQLEASLRSYALRAHLDFGKTGTILITPNGSIKASRPLVTELTVNDELVAAWLRPIAPDAVIDHPKVGKADLRFLLERIELEGGYQRAIIADKGLTGLVVVALLDGEWNGPFQPGWRGVWVSRRVEAGEILDPQAVLDGVSWAPAGEQGCGRTFTIDVA